MVRTRRWRARATAAFVVAVAATILPASVAGAAVPPDPPTNLLAVRGDTQATVSWTPPADDGDAEITGYTVTASPGGDSCTTAEATACAVYGLTNGQAYTFTATATNTAGTSVPSAPSNSVVPAEGAGAFVPLPAPRRIVDSRVGAGMVTDDGLEQGFGALQGGASRQIPVAGRVGLPTDVENVVLSVVAISPTAGGYLTVFSCDGPLPSTSSMNFTKGVTLASTVLTRLGTDDGNLGDVCVFASTTTHIVIDLPGSLSSSAFDPLPSPRRIADSRASGQTDDGEDEAFGALAAGTARPIRVAGRVGMNSEAKNAVLSVVAVTPAGAGYLTVYPCGTARPSTSSMNFTKGTTLANTVITKLGTGASGGDVCVYTSTRTHLIIDVAGSFTSSSFLALPTPKRLVESRAGFTTDDGQQQGFGALQGGAAARPIPIAGRVGLSSSVANVVLSVVAVSPTGGGYFAIYPCGSPRPSTSSMNFTKSTTLANTVITRLGTGVNAGKVCVYSSTTTHIVIDVAGALS